MTQITQITFTVTIPRKMTPIEIDEIICSLVAQVEDIPGATWRFGEFRDGHILTALISCLAHVEHSERELRQAGLSAAERVAAFKALRVLREKIKDAITRAERISG